MSLVRVLQYALQSGQFFPATCQFASKASSCGLDFEKSSLLWTLARDPKGFKSVTFEQTCKLFFDPAPVQHQVNKTRLSGTSLGYDAFAEQADYISVEGATAELEDDGDGWSGLNFEQAVRHAKEMRGDKQTVTETDSGAELGAAASDVGTEDHDNDDMSDNTGQNTGDLADSEDEMPHHVMGDKETHFGMEDDYDQRAEGDPVSDYDDGTGFINDNHSDSEDSEAHSRRKRAWSRQYNSNMSDDEEVEAADPSGDTDGALDARKRQRAIFSDEEDTPTAAEGPAHRQCKCGSSTHLRTSFAGCPQHVARRNARRK